MSTDSLEAALLTASQLIRPGQAHYPLLFHADGITPVAHSPNWLTDPIASEIEQTTELDVLLRNNLNTLNGAGKISAWHLAQAAVHRLFAQVTPDKIVGDLIYLSTAADCDCLTFVGLHGDGVPTRIDLSESVAIMPATMAPPCHARELIFGIDRWGKRLLNQDLPTFRPTIALVVSQRIKHLTETMDADIAKLQTMEESVQRAIRALTLSSGCPFTRSWQISWLNHPAIPYEGIGGYGASGQIEEFPKSRTERPPPVNPELAKDLYAKLATLPASLRAPIELATDRLRTSRVHSPSADTALDLGIASEIVLLNGKNESELRYRFAVRGAYLIAADESDRAIKFEAFRAMYDARSSAAHTGLLSAKLQARLPEFDLLCRSAICTIIEDRAFPMWDDLVLGLKAPQAQIG